MSLDRPTTENNPFTGHRGFEPLEPDRLRLLLDRYRAWLAELDAPDNRRVAGPQPAFARGYCRALVAELAAALAQRPAAPAAA